MPITKAGAEPLFEVVYRAYERCSLIVTTNLPFEDWTEVFGSERLTGALLDRLTHRVHILESKGAVLFRRRLPQYWAGVYIESCCCAAYTPLRARFESVPRRRARHATKPCQASHARGWGNTQ